MNNITVIKNIISRKNAGIEPTETELILLDIFIKEFHLPNDGSQEIIESIQSVFPNEYGNAIDESLIENGFINGMISTSKIDVDLLFPWH